MRRKYLLLALFVLFICLALVDRTTAADYTMDLIGNGEEIRSKAPVQLTADREVAGLDRLDAHLYPCTEDEGLYKGFVLEVGDKRKCFDWENNAMINWPPKLLAGDLDQDGNEELVVVLIHGTGTGVHEEEVHVVKTSDLSEIEVQNPLGIIAHNVKTDIEKDGEKIQVRINVGEETAVISLPLDYAGWFFDDISFTSIQHFYVNGDHLHVDLAAQISPAGFIGDINIIYRFADDKLSLKTISFIPYDRYEAGCKWSEPERVYNTVVPAQAAFTRYGSLYLLDGSREGAPPKKVDTKGRIEIAGWSSDGQWLMYLEKGHWDENSAYSYIWVVSRDGSAKQQIDSRPVMITPKWSPLDNIIAYTTCNSGEEYAVNGDLKLASIRKNKLEITTLLPDDSLIINCIAWSPDGKRLAIGTGDTESKKEYGLICRFDLNGECKELLTIEQAGIAGADNPYLWGTDEIKWSPDGRYLAYYLLFPSASISADGTTVQVLDLNKKDNVACDLGCGLAHGGWLEWSPDSRYLAFIAGCGREAAVNKRLRIADMKRGNEIIECKEEGQVDTQPVWMPDSGGIMFCRGNENDDWLGDTGYRLLVPGQRIWSCNREEAWQITSDQEYSADYYPDISPDGNHLIYARLISNGTGDIYYKLLPDGPELELLRRISGDIGFYGNYYPEWISVYWE